MSPDQKKKLAAYESLCPVARTLLEILSVLVLPITRATATGLLNRAGIGPSGGQRFTLASLVPLLLELRGQFLIASDGQRIKCPSEIREIVARSAERSGRFPKWARLVGGVIDKRHYSYTKLKRSYYERRALFERLRIAVYLDDLAEFHALMEEWDHEYGDSVTLAHPLEEIFSRPFDAAWAGTRDLAIRIPAMYSIALRKVTALEPAKEAVEVLEAVGAGSEALSRPQRELVAWHGMLRGDFAAAAAWPHPEDIVMRHQLQGWRRCALRDWNGAARAFGQALGRVRKDAGRAAEALHPLAGALYLIALLGTRDPVRLREGNAYLSRCMHASEDCKTLFVLLQRALHRLTAAREAAGAPLVRPAQLESTSPVFRPLAFAALCWVDPAVAKKCRDGMLRLKRTAAAGGYRWIESELVAVLNRARAEGDEKILPRQAVAELGAVPLVDAIAHERPWEHRLRALQFLGDEVRSKADAKQPAHSRLTWRVGGSQRPESVHPFEQRRGKSGRWTAGRPVALERLARRRDAPFVTEHDARICKGIEEVSHSRGAHYELPLANALEALVGHPLVFRKDHPSLRMKVVRSEPRLRVKTEGATVRIDMEPRPPERDVIGVFESSTRLAITVFKPEHRRLAAALGPGALQAPAASRDRIVRAVSSVSSLVAVHSDFDGKGEDAAEVPADPRPHFFLTPRGEGLRAEPHVQPFPAGGPTYHPGEGDETVFASVAGRRSRARRDLGEERRRLDAALQSCGKLREARWNGAAWTVPAARPSLELVDQLQQLGDKVVVKWPAGEAMKIKHRADLDRLSLKLSHSRNWFELEGEVEVDEGRVLGLRELLDRIGKARGRFVPLGGKGFLALSDRFRRQVEELSGLVDRHGKQGLRFHASRAHALQGLVEGAGAVDADSQWAERVRRFREAQALDPAVPSALRAELRDYQVEGFRWASRLAAWGAGACLADDMGLGKTLQALAVALERAPSGPTLVVAPTSVCPNWIDEARRFTPTLNPFQFGPGDRAKMIAGLKPLDLMVCSYGLLHREADRLASVAWATVVLDEAQAIKNRATLRSRAAMRLDGAFRMIATGTPIENNLGELWNLFQFINPGLLGSAESFATRFAGPIHQERGAAARRRLKGLIRPFVLRRTKSAVLEELPSRTEITIRVEMAADERALYEAARRNAVERAEEARAERVRGHLKILAEIMRLRRACCHPSLIAPDLGLRGAKLESFGYTVADLIAGGHKALVFSQFVDHLKIVRAHLDREGVDYRYLDGSTPPRRRTREVDAFQAGKGDLFLISLRAGGQGLNLTAADYVLHLDPWWNPAVEDQASDRAHRIGQTRPVTIYRFVMKDTIEERIVDLHASKRDLADSLLEGTDMSGKVSADELLRLMRDG